MTGVDAVRQGYAERAAMLRAVDELMRDHVARAAPLRFDVARTDADRDVAYRLRYRVAIEHGWADPAEFPHGRETDAFDREAVHVVGWDGDVLAATGRLIAPRPDRPLPTEALFDVAVAPRGRVVNVDRLAVAPGYSDRRHRTMFGLMGATWGQTRALGCHAWVGINTEAMVRLYRLLGFTPTPLAPPRLYWGEQRLPVLCDGTTDATAAIERHARSRASSRRTVEAIAASRNG